MKYCPVCDRKYPNDAAVCEHDGVALKRTELREDPLIGKTINGKYRVLRKLGAGGMGAVYLAEQMSIGRKVALKVLQGEFARDDQFINRFHQEARLAANLNHRHVVTIHDFDQTDDGSLFIAMEYVEGKNLRDLLQEGQLALGRVVRLARQIAEGLRAAHQAGVIHRDIKPENIMIVQGAEEVKLMDFGIARLRNVETVARLTQPGMIMGTPAYIAPEQIEGREVNEKTDIYAFGCVLYEMLSGDSPFKAPTPSAVLMKHLTELPEPLRKLRSEVPPSLDRLVMQALDKKPERRQNIEEVRSELKVEEERLISEFPQTVPVPVLEYGKKKQLFLAGGGLLLILIVVLILAKSRVGYWDTPRVSSPVLVHSLLVEAGKTELQPGENVALKARAHYTDGSEKEVEQGVQWISSNPLTAPIFANGQVQARGPGETEIIARLGEVAAPALKLTVKASIAPDPQPQVHIVSLELKADKPKLKVKERTPLRIKAAFSDGSKRGIGEGVQWQNSDPSVVNIDAKGDLKALKEGKTTVGAHYQGLRAEALVIEVGGKNTEVVAKPALAKPAAKEAPPAPLRPADLEKDIVAPPAPPSVAPAPEAQPVPSVDKRNVISDYIKGEQQRRRR